MMTRYFTGSMNDFKTAGGLGGGEAPPIRKTKRFAQPSLTASMVMARFFHRKMDGFKKGGWRGAAPPFANKMIPTTSPPANMDDRMLLFDFKHGLP